MLRLMHFIFDICIAALNDKKVGWRRSKVPKGLKSLKLDCHRIEVGPSCLPWQERKVQLLVQGRDKLILQGSGDIISPELEVYWQKGDFIKTSDSQLTAVWRWDTWLDSETGLCIADKSRVSRNTEWIKPKFLGCPCLPWRERAGGGLEPSESDSARDYGCTSRTERLFAKSFICW